MLQSMNPQPGSSLWNMAAAIGTEMDLIAQNVAIEVAGTFTALQEIENKEYTVSSKLDSLQSIIQTDFAGTFTQLQTLQNTTDTINSKINLLDASLISGFENVFSTIANIESDVCVCLPTILSVPNDGTTLSSAGVYCLNSDVTLNAGASILITGSAIVLNLNEHTVTDGSGIIIENNNVTVKNGIINNVTGLNDAGVTATASNEMLTLQDLEITNCTEGINILDAINVFIERVKISGCTNAGVNLEGTQNYMLDSCQVADQTAPGFVCTSIESITIKNCSSTHTSLGFQATDDSGIVFDSCYASNNSNQGFLINGTSSSPATCLLNCIVENSGANGFDILGGTGVPLFYVQNCSALSNVSTNTGFNIQQQHGALIACDAQGYGNGFSIISGTSLLKSCCASNNNGSGFLVANGVNSAVISECKATNNEDAGFDLSAYVAFGGSASVVEKCTATNNTVGFSGPSSNDVIYAFNNAINNTTNFLIYAQPDDESGISSPESLLTSTSRLYGDNLKNV